MTLDVDMARLLEQQLARKPHRDKHPSDLTGIVAQLRREHEEQVSWMTPPAVRDRVANVEDLELVIAAGTGVPARIYRPSEPEDGTLIWLHGGGWVTGSLETADVAARALCARAGLVVVSVDYRLAPEHPWPAAVDDARTAVSWVAKKVRSEELPGPVLVGGDSAGANIAAVTALDPDLRDLLHGQLLVYPAVRLDADPPGLPSREKFREGFGLDWPAVEMAVQAYVPRAEDRTDPRVSPALSSTLADAPPTIVVTAACDLLCDEGNEYAEALGSVGVPVRLFELPGLIHGCLDMIGQSSAADKATTDVAEALRTLSRQHPDLVDAETHERKAAR